MPVFLGTTGQALARHAKMHCGGGEKAGESKWEAFDFKRSPRQVPNSKTSKMIGEGGREQVRVTEKPSGPKGEAPAQRPSKKRA